MTGTLTIQYPTLENTSDQNFNVGDLAQIRDTAGSISDLNNAAYLSVPSIVNGIVAAGTDQASATPLVLLSGYSWQEVTDVGLGTGVSLPIPVLPTAIVVINAGSNPLLVYPPSGGFIWNGSSPVTVNAGISVFFLSSSISNYYHL
jgi:hypothetical protein